MPKSLIRQAVSTDFPTLLDIDKSSFEPGVAYNSSELSYFMRRDGAATFVAELGGRIVGFILLEIHRRRGSAVMVTLDVRQENRRRGIATDLLAASEEMLRNNDIAHYELQVDVNNAGAMEFYKKHGFAVVKRLPNYYSNGCDAYLMTRTLSAL